MATRLTWDDVKKRCEGCRNRRFGTTSCYFKQRKNINARSTPCWWIRTCPIGRAVPPVEPPAPVEEPKREEWPWPLGTLGTQECGCYWQSDGECWVQMHDCSSGIKPMGFIPAKYFMPSLILWMPGDEPPVEEAKVEEWPFGTLMESAVGGWWQKGPGNCWISIDSMEAEWKPGHIWPEGLLEGDTILWAPGDPLPGVEADLTPEKCRLIDAEAFHGLLGRVRECEERLTTNENDWIRALRLAGLCDELTDKIETRFKVLEARVDGIAPTPPVQREFPVCAASWKAVVFRPYRRYRRMRGSCSRCRLWSCDPWCHYALFDPQGRAKRLAEKREGRDEWRFDDVVHDARPGGAR